MLSLLGTQPARGRFVPPVLAFERRLDSLNRRNHVMHVRHSRLGRVTFLRKVNLHSQFPVQQAHPVECLEKSRSALLYGFFDRYGHEDPPINHKIERFTADTLTLIAMLHALSDGGLVSAILECVADVRSVEPLVARGPESLPGLFGRFA